MFYDLVSLPSLRAWCYFLVHKFLEVENECIAAVFEITPPSIPGTQDTRSEQAPNLVSAAPNPRRLYELAPAANSRVSPSLLELAFLGCHWSLRIVLARGTMKPSCGSRLVGLPVEPCLRQQVQRPVVAVTKCSSPVWETWWLRDWSSSWHRYSESVDL